MKRKSHKQKLLDLLTDGAWHKTPEIIDKVYGVGHQGTCRIASRVDELRNEGHDITSRRDPDRPTVWWYQLGNPPTPKPKMVPVKVMLDGVEMVRFVPERATQH